MANPALMVLPLNGSLQGTDRSGVFSAVGAGAVRYAPAPGARINYCGNPSAAVDTSGYFPFNATVSRITTDDTYATCLETTITGSGGMFRWMPSSGDLDLWFLDYTKTYRISFDVKLISGPSSGMFAQCRGGNKGVVQASFGSTNNWTAAVGVWERKTFTQAASTLGRGPQKINVNIGPQSGTGHVFRTANLVIEEETGSDLGNITAPVWLNTANGLLGSANGVPQVAAAQVWVEGAATNLVANPWCATNNTGWSAANGSHARTTSYAYQGPAAGLLTATGANAEAIISVSAAASGHIAHAIVRNLTANSRSFQLTYNGSDIGSPVSVAAGVAQEISAALTGTGGAANLGVKVTDSANTETFVIYYAGVYAGSSAGSPVPAINSAGTIQTGDAWTGTAHASTSTRTAATISMDEAGRIDPVSGSLAFRYIRDIDTGGVEPILDVGEGTTGKDRLRIRVNASDKLEVSWQSNGASETTLASTESIAVGTEYWVYVAWSGTSVWVGIDANALASGTRNAPQNTWGTTDLVVGTTAGSAGFGDLLIADRPLLPAERGAVRARSPISMGVLAGAPYKHFQLRPY